MTRPTRKARSGPSAWPWPADTPLDRSRRVALSYRDALRLSDPDAADAIDAWAVDHGQGWVAGGAWDYDPHELLTLQQAADRAGVELRTIYAWHQRGLRYADTVDGKRIVVRELVRYIRDKRRARIRRTTL